MECKLCGREVESKFYLHLNSCHKMKKNDYLDRFPEQIEEYENQKPKQIWNKGKTAKDNSSVAQYAKAAAEYSRRPEVRKMRSDNMKERYKKGDILSPEMRAKVVRAGNQGWQNKLAEASDEERTILLKKFTEAGNNAQAEKRHMLTPEDYIRLYPFAKGVARYYNCDFCGKKHIMWFGGKPRPKKRFCNNICYMNFLDAHPFHLLPHTVIRYFSDKMDMEFCLRSQYELWFAEWLDENKMVHSWHTPKYILYEYLGKLRRYYPDFLINNCYLIEIKSNYVAHLQGYDAIKAKIEAAQEYCKNHNWIFRYFQFDRNNLTKKLMLGDVRIKKLNNDF